MDTDYVKQGFLWIVTSGVVSGILSAYYVLKNMQVVLFLVSIAFLVSLFLFLKKEKEYAVFVLCFACSFTIGFLRVPHEHIVPNIIQGARVFEGTIYRDKEERQGRVDYYIEDVEAILDEGVRKLEGRLLVRAPLGSSFGYGDRVRFEGTFDLPSTFETESGRVFDYEGYLLKDGIVGILSFADGEYIGEGDRSFIKTYLFKIKNVLIQNIETVVPVPESTLSLGLLLGERGTFTRELTHDFRIAGLIHIVVLSGYNIALIAEYVRFGLRKRFSKNKSLVYAGVAIILFALLVGGGATVIRATLMGLLVLVSRGDSRRYNIGRALTFTVCLMILYNPLTLILDVSFHLSFLATIGLIYIAPYIERFFTKITERFALREIVVTTLATQICVLPYLLYRIGDLSLVAPVANILVLPVVPFIMFLTFVVGITGIVSTVCAHVVSLILTPLLSYVIFVTEYIAQLPFAHSIVPPFHILFVPLFYMAIAWGLYYLRQKPISIKHDDEVDDFEIIDYDIHSK